MGVLHGSTWCKLTLRHPYDPVSCPPVQAAEFYKTWERYGSLSNFSPHPIWMPEEPVSDLNSQLLIAQAAHHLSSGASAPAGAPPARPAQQNGVPRAAPAAAQLQQQPGAAGLAEAEGLQQGRHGQGRWWPTLEHYYQAQKFNWDCRRGLQGDSGLLAVRQLPAQRI